MPQSAKLAQSAVGRFLPAARSRSAISATARPSLLGLAACIALGIGWQPAQAIKVTIDTSSARAMLNAIGNPNLTSAQADAVVQMPGNQGALRKLKEFKLPVSDASFSRAIYETAHSQPISDAVSKNYFLDIVKSHAVEIKQLLDSIEKDPAGFQTAIQDRISLFSSKDADVHLSGYIVAGGDGGGYAFNGTDFYLNIGFIREPLLARNVTTHEMYHAVQGAFASDRGMTPANDEANTTCGQMRRVFDSLYREGSAMEVDDQSLVARSNTEIAQRKRTDMADGLRRITDSTTLLEMAVDALKSSPAVSFDDVYAVGFYGHGVLYSIGYVMARDIVEASGPSGLAVLLNRPAYEFALTYTHLPKYGSSSDYPKLGPNTIAAAEQLRAGCK